MQLRKNNRDLLKWVKYLPFLFLIQLFSFNLNAQNKHTLPEGIKIVDLPDSFFAYKNLETSLVVKNFQWEAPPDSTEKWHPLLFKDSTKQFRLYRLNDTQMKLFWVWVLYDFINHSNFVTWWAHSYIISREPKIGELTPIIIRTETEDYDELTYVLLDKDDKPVSRLPLWGGISDGGPESHTDSSATFGPYKVSQIQGLTISSYILNVTYKTSKRGNWSENGLATVDSITYRTTINKKGKIKTYRIDSTRYQRIVDMRTILY
ncbi:MAG TPA: hypothetical protein VK808_01840 [Bacteroidia bacterium]|nr:hypothetical protein [Bacteroidia bacterium]